MNNTNNNTQEELWYIVKDEQGYCQIVALTTENPHQEAWGPVNSFEEAIAKRIGLIRSGKCKPL